MPEWMTGSVIFWMLITILSVVVEAFTLNLSAIWFAFGGVAALVAASLEMAVLPQLVIFVVFSALLLLLVRPVTKTFLKPKGARTNADRILGENALVTQAIDNTAMRGEIRLLGQIWSARSANGSPIPEGETVRVLEIVGVKAIVELIEKEN